MSNIAEDISFYVKRFISNWNTAKDIASLHRSVRCLRDNISYVFYSTDIHLSNDVAACETPEDLYRVLSGCGYYEVVEPIYFSGTSLLTLVQEVVTCLDGLSSYDIDSPVNVEYVGNKLPTISVI